MQSEKYATLFSRLRGYGKQLLRGIFSGIFLNRSSWSSRRLQLVLFGMALLIIALVLGSAFREKRKAVVVKSQELQNPPGTSNLEANNVSYSFTNKQNVKEWEVRADKANYFKDKKLIILDHLEALFYRPNGSVYRLTGKRGTIDMDTEGISVQGDITGVMPDDTRFATQSFAYDNKKRLITTPDKVFITRDKFSMEGVGMVLDIREEKFFLLDKVKAMENK